ncbi:porin [Pyruvatibacter mobilis]|uniref:porin n=1 Tax=Pyruvatibacter mobilis TaxID=1712261 RepID=UPI003BB0C922
MAEGAGASLEARQADAGRTLIRGRFTVAALAALTMPMMATPAQADGLFEVGPVEFGGAIRGNVTYRDYDTPDEFDDWFEFDTLIARADFDTGRFIGSAQGRLYYYHQDGQDHDTAFVHHAWLGYRFDDGSEVHAGVHQVPFGLLPYASDNWFFSIAYYVGLEDDYDLGFKYVSPDWDGWSLQAAYYIGDEGDGIGRSEDSARYSYDIVDEGANGNDEENQFNLRVARTFFQGDDDRSLELGASGQWGEVPNDITGQDGDHWAAAVHLRGEEGRFGYDLEFVTYDINQKVPAGLNPDVVQMGAFDFPYNVASGGEIYLANLRYSPEYKLPFFESWTVYNNFSVLTKDPSGFEDTIHNITGAYFSKGPWFITLDYGVGQGSPFITRDFTNGLAAGSDEWDSRINLNVALYY